MTLLYSIFVYGTLKQGYQNHTEALKNCFVGLAQTVEKFPLYIALDRRVPFLVAEPGRGEYVFGEIYQVDQPLLDELDLLEAVDQPMGYQREPLKVRMDSGELLLADAYFKARSHVKSDISEVIAHYEYDPLYRRNTESLG